MFPRRTFLTGTIAAGTTALLPSVALALPEGSYRVQPRYRPTSTGGVDQALIRKTPAYIDSKETGWWVCGHAALLSAINFMRQGSVTEAHKITQLQWTHDRLRELQTGYATSDHKEASIDALEKVVARHKSDEFAIRKIHGMDRSVVRDEMLRTLDRHSSYAIALTQIEINGHLFGHFVAIHYIDYRPGTEQGGPRTIGTRTSGAWLRWDLPPFSTACATRERWVAIHSCACTDASHRERRGTRAHWSRPRSTFE